MKSAPCIDYVDVSPGRLAGDAVDGASLLAPTSATAGTEAPESPETAAAEESAESTETTVPPTDTDQPIVISADIHAVMLGLWASGLRCILVYALAPAMGAAGPLAVGTALVIQVTGAAVSLSGAHSLWKRRDHGRYVYALITILTCLCTLAALLAPAGV